MPRTGQAERGSAALAVILALVGIVGLATIAALTEAAVDEARREQRTATALAQARDALIGFAIRGGDTSAGRPGDLPCPDLDNDGSADAVPGCSAATSRIGRLPWRTLGLPDLRDGNGERLWYAVSVNFKNNPRTSCLSAGQSGCLNSDTPGTITVRNPSGAIVNNGTLAVRSATTANVALSGVIAVVFSPGPALKRVGAGASQDRSCTRGAGTDSACLNDQGRCTGTTPAEYVQTARCNPSNYLDIAGPPDFTVAGATGSAEDNATFADSTSTDGFIAGDVRNASGEVIVNDRLITIRYADLMPLLEQRVVRQVFDCLTEYASANGGKFPFAADDDTLGFDDLINNRVGRLPDQPFSSTEYVNGSMSEYWGTNCVLSASPPWWTNWKDQAFYGFASNLAPDGGFGTSCTYSPCLAVHPPPSTNNKRLIVLLSGRSLPGQTRSTGNWYRSRYLEGDNVSGSMFWEQSATTGTFNDVVVFK